MIKTSRDPSAYLASLPDGVREPMQELYGLIAPIMSGHPRTVWEGKFWGGTDQVIMGYGDLSMVQSRGRRVDWFMVGLAVQKNYFSVYVNAVEGSEYVAERYRDRLGKAKVGKSSISFRRLEDVNLEALADVLRVAKARLEAV